MLTGCVQHAFFPSVNAATARVLAAEGCDVVIPPSQGCCGALSLHSGRSAEAARFASALLDSFADVDFLIVNAAGCGSSLKEIAALLPDDPRAAALAPKVRDLSEFLVELGPVAPRHPVPVAAAYHDACHLAHAQGCALSRAPCCGPFPAWTCGRSRTRRSAAARPASGTS
ncbi:(Fe-S)-binding protein [Dactylosporangium darangshiense]|uniref:(Fe-S)-binding protein n=1 Tax=Dactylosporangium darangshiense TaxID=579108 RepID=UPI003632078B